MSADPTRILVVNPNTSNGVTEAVTNALSALAPKHMHLTGVTGRFGAQIVSTEAEDVIAAYAALDLVARHARGCDAIIMGISFDTGLRAVQSVVPMPVVGITEAALHLATAGGRRVSILFFGEPSRGLYESVIAGYDIHPVSFHAIELTSVSDYLTPNAQDQAAITAAQAAISQGAEAIVICGAAIVGMAARLQAAVSVPLYDGCAALNLCLARLDGPTAVNSAQPAPVGPTENVPDHISALINGSMFR